MNVNAHGVIVDCEDVIACTLKGQRIAYIELAPLGEYWIAAWGAMLGHGGSASPLCVKHPVIEAETREECVEFALVAIEKFAASQLAWDRVTTAPWVKPLRDWILGVRESLVPVSLDLFAGIA